MTRIYRRYIPDYIVEGVIFLVLFYFFIQSMCPTVYWLDTGEISTALSCLGLAHSPSFPLFMLANRPILWMPMGDIAYRGNMTSVIWGIMTAIVLYRMCLLFCKGSYTKILAVLFIFVLAFNPMYWFQCLKAEVYSLHVFLALVIVFFSLKIIKNKCSPLKNMKYWSLIVFVYALSLCNHSLLTLHLFPALVYLFLISRSYKMVHSKTLMLYATLFILGVSTYLYLPVRSFHNPYIDLGNPEHITTFLFSFTRKGSVNRFLGNSLEAWFSNFINYFQLMHKYFSVWLLPMVFVAAVFILIKRTKIALFWIIIILTNIGITLMNKQFNTNPDTGPAYLMLSTTLILFIIGIFLIDLGKSRLGARSGMIYLSIIILCILFYLEDGIKKFNEKYSLRDNNAACRLGRAVLDTCLPRSYLFTGFHYNVSYILRYLQSAERYRNDIALIDRPEVVFWPGGLEKFLLKFPNAETLMKKMSTKEVLEHLKYRGVQNCLILTEREAKEIVSKFLAEFAMRSAGGVFVYWFPSEDDTFIKAKIYPAGIMYRIADNEVRIPALEQYENNIWNRFLKRMHFGELLANHRSDRKKLSDLLVNLGNAMDLAGDSMIAVETYKRALTIFPDSWVAKVNLSKILSSTSKHEKNEMRKEKQ